MSTSAASNYLEDKLLDHVLNATAYTPPSIYLALFLDPSSDTEDKLEENDVANAHEVSASGTAYERMAIDFTDASSGSCTTASVITFPTCSGSNWGTVTHIAIMDGDTEGADNVLFWGEVTTPKTIEVGDTFQVSAGNLTITLN